MIKSKDKRVIKNKDKRVIKRKDKRVIGVVRRPQYCTDVFNRRIQLSKDGTLQHNHQP